ncbi:protein of unknown function [Streptomyces sp. 2131.1]|uniref:DUF397 domain-containing protein n=1 Tax=Streptomyces sp. 2131.1 TaxID=1855346 RepID=UPI000897BD4B|nr:DUF397 domain-containing protein [Streptomyces sp. 2131.1]SED16059.1 protein of unknown function [Streptomyces sp. 2131.1]
MKVFQFVKSSYSTLEKDCVEVARNVPGAVAVRDSKRAAGPVLVLTPTAWNAFRASLSRQP